MIEPENVKDDPQYQLDDECARFQELMSERVGAGEDLQNYDHMLTCERCRALVHDLEQIAIAARELMDREPSRDLWPTLSEAIERDDEPDDGPDELPVPAVN